MLRYAFSFSLLVIVAASLFYIYGVNAVLIAAFCLCVSTVACCIFYCRQRGNFKSAVVLLLGAFYCLYLVFSVEPYVNAVQSLGGQSRTVVCTVVEEPEIKEKSVKLCVEAVDGNLQNKGLPSGLKFNIYIAKTESASSALEGDILSVETRFFRVDDAYKKYRFAEGVYIDAFCEKPEIIGHKDTFYTKCIGFRKSVKSAIDRELDGDEAALLKGILLGDTSDMSDRLYSDFKRSGVCHITAVSGMHIGALCTIFVSLMSFFMNKRKASLLAFLPLILSVLISGMTPSAVRAGIMCAIMLLGNVLLHQRDSLTSLGISIAVMLFINPFYICSLSFQLSCSATAGVILATPFATKYVERIGSKLPRFAVIVFSSFVMMIVQSVGAVLCTLPFQIIEFGFVSVIAPLASALIGAAVVYILGVSVAALVIGTIPFIDMISKVLFCVAELLLQYICVVVRLLGSLDFSYIPFGTSAAVLWCGLSLVLLGAWLFLGNVGGKRYIALLITALLIISLWTENIANRNSVEVAVLDVGDGLCTVVSNDDKCVIIGCGDDYTDFFVLQDYMKLRGITEISAVVLPNGDENCVGGYMAVVDKLNPKVTVVPQGINVAALNHANRVEIIENTVMDAYIKGVEIKPHINKYGCVYEICSYNRRVLVSNLYYDTAEIEMLNVDVAVSCREIPNTDVKVLVISNSNYVGCQTNANKRMLTSADYSISVKLTKGKEITAYAGKS